MSEVTIRPVPVARPRVADTMLREAIEEHQSSTQPGIELRFAQQLRAKAVAELIGSLLEHMSDDEFEQAMSAVPYWAAWVISGELDG